MLVHKRAMTKAGTGRTIKVSTATASGKGRRGVDFSNDERQLVSTRELREGDMILTVGGGHGFRMLEDTVLLEIKQGAYRAGADRERF